MKLAACGADSLRNEEQEMDRRDNRLKDFLCRSDRSALLLDHSESG